MQPRILYILLLLITTVSVYGQERAFLKRDGKRIIDGKGEEIILRGMGLGGWMLQEGYMLQVSKIGQQQHVIRRNLKDLVGEEKTALFYEKWLQNHTREIDIDSLAAWGFNSVRLPMHYNLFTLPVEEEPVAGENTWIETGFRMTDSLLAWCEKNKMYLILDLHAAPGGQGNDLNISDRDPSKPSLWDSEANQRKTVALWKKLAERYGNEPWIGAYDIINEPNWGFESKDDKNGCSEQKNEPLKKLMVEITEAIRSVDKNHIIIIEGNCWGNNYNGVLPPWDENMVVSLHKYWNYNDQSSIQKFLDIRERYNVPVWLGESGENSNLWFRDAIRLMESNGIGWAWWPLKKLGFNNPLQVKVPQKYENILAYWREEGQKPSEEDAFEGIMELAENVKLENCIYHKDVIDAMFRQVASNKVLPFKSATLTDAIRINAVDYDMGRNGFAYFDLDTGNYYVSTGGKRTPWNQGRTYRNDGVDIQKKEGDKYYVSNFEKGEWLQYTINVSSKGIYEINLQLASEGQAVKATVNVSSNNGEANSKKVSLDKNPTKWNDLTFDNIRLSEGINTIRIAVQEGSIKFDGFEIKQTNR